ncbi:MAG: rod shape-determining protein MreD [Candidatus Latescibacterota bacterium]|nr:rod shape-determining protein MreD [Candidatus Latescibacterota bacterium]
MLAVVRHILYLMLALVLQTTWLHHFEIAGVLPDLVLLVLIYIALTTGQLEATILAFIVGLCQDSYAPADLGLNALAKSVVGFAVGFLRGGIMADTLQVQVAVVITAIGIHDFIYYVGASAYTMTEVSGLLLRYGLPRALYTALFALVLGCLLRLRRQVAA